MLWETLSILIGLPLFVLHFYRRRRQKNEPPLDKGFLPWLGHAVEFGKDAAKFLKRMKEKHGDIFTVRMAGNYVTVLLDPNSFDSVLNDTVCLDFTHIRNQLVQKVFALQLPGMEPTSERKWMEGHFQGLSLFKISTSMKAHLQSLLLSDNASCDSSEWRQGGLFDLCYSLLFRAGFLTLFESRDDPAAVYREFRKFDGFLTKLARCTLNHEEKKTVRSCQERLWKLLSPGWLSEESDTWQQSYHRFLREEGMDEEMQNRALLLQLWITQAECWNSSLRCATYQLCKGERVSECLTHISDSELLASTCSEEKKCNAGPAAFWLLGFLLTHPEAMKAVKSEIRGLRDTSLKHPPVSLLEAHCTPVLDSVLSETLRLTAAVMIRREVVQDKMLLMADGQEYRLRRGDRVCLFPLLSPQMDPQIHPEPQIFKYNRFLNEDMTVKDHFHKNGKKLKYYTMPWGAGRSSCVGKEFAVTAIKQFVFLLLTHLDLETCDPEAKLPPVNSSRYGFGMLQPDGDLQVRYRLRRTQHEM